EKGCCREQQANDETLLNALRRHGNGPSVTDLATGPVICRKRCPESLCIGPLCCLKSYSI
ncbi:MAG TPA: hypothetical protein VLW75_11635, partial [Rhizomicrobium sp.]|nr:hypothetical protein [Rhizomicrobium sp.]